MAVKKDLLAQYATVKQHIATFTKEKDEIGKLLLADMEKNGEMDIDNEFGKFAVSMKKSWEYSDLFYKKDADLKDLRDKEQADGTAKFITTPFLRFTAPKAKK